MKRLSVGVFGALVLAASSPAALAYDSTFDSSFSGDGVRHLGAADNALISVADDGTTTVLTQDFRRRGDTLLTLRRLDVAGTLDASFSSDGVANTRMPSGRYVHELVVLPDGRMLLGGNAARPFVMRLTTEGAVDSSFGRDGVRLFGLRGDDLLTMTVDGEGRMLAVSQQFEDGPRMRADSLVTRVLPGGRLDSAFGNDGQRRIDRQGFDFHPEITVDDGNRPVVLGGAVLSPGPFEVIRLTEGRGRLDASFSGNGVAHLDLGGSSSPKALRVTAAGIVGAGPAKAFRLAADGTRDLTYGVDGVVQFIAPDLQSVSPTMVDADGGLVLGGFEGLGDTNNSLPVVGAVGADNVVDSGIGPSGTVRLDVGEGESYAQDVQTWGGRLVVLVASLVDAETRYDLVRLGSTG